MLIGMTIWEIRALGAAQRLPADRHDARRPPVHRSDVRAWVNLAWVGLGGKVTAWLSLAEEPSVWISFVVSMLVLALVMRKG